MTGFGLYIHWPYCLSKCPYCDFNSHVSASIDYPDWGAAYLKALARQSEGFENRRLLSIYFGGGTPSLMLPADIGSIIEAAAGYFDFDPAIEITLEANPTSAPLAKLKAFRAAGINRLSLGVQALNDADLKRLGRTHSAAEGIRALAIACNTFERVSFDLIYARQDQSLAQWQAELERALSEVNDHFSLYQLTIEEGTVFKRLFDEGRLRGLPSQDLGAEMYEATLEICKARGMEAYEVSNFARPGAEGRHNLNYWLAGDYLGVGPGAYGRFFREGVRFESRAPSDPSGWLKAALSGGCAAPEKALSADDYLGEVLMMGLRLKNGIALERLEAIAGFRQKGEIIERFISEGLLERTDTCLKATMRGRLLLDALLRELL